MDAQDAYRRAVDEILARDVDAVIHSGDVFDTIRPANHVIMDFLRQTSRITREGIPYVGVAGNHETPRLRSTSAALGYAFFIGADFAYGHEQRRVRQSVNGSRLAVTLVPHGAVLEGDIAVLPDREADVNVLVTHGTVPGLKVQGHELGEVDLPNPVLEGGFDYVALGHYHYFHQHRKNAYYAGAPERFSFAEAGADTGFLILDFSGDDVEVEHVPVAARPMIDLKQIDASEMDGTDLTDKIRERTGNADLDDAIVRLKVVDAPAGVAGDVDRALLRDLRNRCLNFSLEVSGAAAVAAQNGEVSAAAFGPLEEEFREFVETKKRDGLDGKLADEFLERGVEYLRSAAEKERAEP